MGVPVNFRTNTLSREYPASSSASGSSSDSEPSDESDTSTVGSSARKTAAGKRKGVGVSVGTTAAAASTRKTNQTTSRFAAQMDQWTQRAEVLKEKGCIGAKGASSRSFTRTYEVCSFCHGVVSESAKRSHSGNCRLHLLAEAKSQDLQLSGKLGDSRRRKWLCLPMYCVEFATELNAGKFHRARIVLLEHLDKPEKLG